MTTLVERSLQPAPTDDPTSPLLLEATPEPQRRPGALAKVFKPGWPLAAIFVPFPLWWLIGLSEWACLLFAIPMAFQLVRQHRVVAPARFGWWLLFLAWVVGGVFLLNVDAVGAVADDSSTRYITWAYRLSWYLAITVVALYVLNKRKELSATRVSRIISFLFFSVVGGGLLGIALPNLEFPSLLELVLPNAITQVQFVNKMIHPQAAQLMQVLGYLAPRPSAPFSYANIWGLNYAVTLPFFLYAWLGKDAGWRRYAAPFILLISAIPVIYSLNRGMWGALVVMALFVAIRAALSGRPAMMGGVLAGAVVVATLVAATALGPIVATRFSNEGSEQGRTNLGTLSVTSVAKTSPVVGLGSTRNVQGNFNSITGGATAECPRCSPPALGTQGQLWLVVFSQGLVGLVLYLGFFGLTFARSLRPHSPVVTMGLTVLVASFVTMPVYNAIGVALMVVMIAVALLNRETSSPLPSLSTYFGPLRRHLGILAVCVLVGLELGAVWQYVRGNADIATQTVMLPTSPNLPSGGDGPMGLDTEAQLLASPSVAAAVKESTGTTLAPDSRSLRVVAVPNSRVLRIIYEADSAEHAADGARAATEAFLTERQSRLDSERDSEIDYLREQAAGLDSSVRTLDEALTTVGESDASVPLAATRATRERRWELLTQIQQTNAQMARVIGTPGQAGSSLLATTVVPKNDQWLVALTTGGMLGLLAGAGGAMATDARGRRLRSANDVIEETGMSVLGVVSSEDTGSRRSRSASRIQRPGFLTGPRPSARPTDEVALALVVHEVDLLITVSARGAGRDITEALEQSAVRFRMARLAVGDGAPAVPTGRSGRRTRVVLVVPYGSRADAVATAAEAARRVGYVVVGVVLCS